MKESEQKGEQPKKVGYFKYLRLCREAKERAAGKQDWLEAELAFMQKYRPGGFIYWLRSLPRRISGRIERYKIEHLKLGRQKWKAGQLYIEKIPCFVSSEAAQYLTAILRDYLRAYAKNAYAVGNALFEREGEENTCFKVRAVAAGDEPADGALEEWRKMVTDAADLFDRAADLCAAAWEQDDWEEGERLWKEYRAALAGAFDALKPIFQDLDD